MAFDGVFLYGVVQELKGKITNNTIERIYQPRSDELVLHIRSRRKEEKLLISINPTHCRINLSSKTHSNPKTPPMFCMLLRKHLVAGKITGVFQHELERVVEVTISNYDEFMNPAKYRLIIEIMGKHSNVVLVDDSKDLVIDSMKRITAEVSRYRQLLPGLIYANPPMKKKVNFLEDDLAGLEETISKKISQNCTTTISKWLLDNIMGIDGSTSKEICFRAGIHYKEAVKNLSGESVCNLLRVLQRLKRLLLEGDFKPRLYYDKKTQNVKDFWIYPVESLMEATQKFRSVNEVADLFFQRKGEALKVESARKKISRPLRKSLKKLRQGLSFCKQRLDRTSKKDTYKLWGEILTANLYQVKPNKEKITLPNFYDSGNPVEIPLNPNLSPSQNAQSFFKEYKKLQTAEKIIGKRKVDYHQEINYLEGILLSLDHCQNIQDVSDIESELQSQGYLKAPKKSPQSAPSKPLRFRTSDGFVVFVGKNNKQNDFLTLRDSRPKDIWIHAKDIPGSHVVISAHDVPVSDEALIEACTLAATFSQARESSNVPVDYTLVKYVKKPTGAKPGLVIYTNEKTLYVTPDKALVEKLSF